MSTALRSRTPAGLLRRGMLAGTAVLTATATALLPVSPAWAHAELKATTPAADSTVAKAPASVHVTFSEKVSGASTGLRVLDVKGAVRSRPATYSGSSVSAATPGLPKGRYALVWSVVSGDGHRVTSARAFSVGLPTPAAPAKTLSMTDGSGKKRTARLSGDRVGVRSLALPVRAIDGTVSLSHPKLPTALVWKAAGRSARGMLPFPGTYSVTVRVRVSQFHEVVLVGSLTARS
ncbi:copper resistance CopC family protein [Motilibacter aurantiacus]|uniref:copper resistance CopC family protein n=1 Tax=Motilibacter aurantiacus TaxID=2714955 RepID=UPI001408C389|nr:copper resistance CopC family protein [Motilibacter aurantiacus]NHC45808.1 copper resistance protein CopC [Motilibacter aurantiacus]